MTAVGIAGSPTWADEISAKLPAYDAVPLRYGERTGYVARLSDERVALMLVDGADEDWRFWTVTPKISPATRRIPVVLVTDDARQRDEALRSGTNLVVGRSDLIDALPMLLAEL